MFAQLQFNVLNSSCLPKHTKKPEEPQGYAPPLGLLHPYFLAPESGITYPYNTNWAATKDDVIAIYTFFTYYTVWIQRNG